MGSIVTKNVGDYEIWAGNPAKMIRKRFSDDVIKDLLQIQWWEKDDDYISAHAKYIRCPKEFIKAQ